MTKKALFIFLGITITIATFLFFAPFGFVFH